MRTPLGLVALASLPLACSAGSGELDASPFNPDRDSTGGGAYPETGAITDPTGSDHIAGAQVCVVGHDDTCASTDTTGAYALTIPIPFLYTPGGLTVTADGHYGTTRLWRYSTYLDNPEPFPGDVELLTTAQMAALAQAGGIAFPAPGKAFLEMSVVDVRNDGTARGGEPGATVMLQPASGGAISPVYADDSGNLDLTLRATSSSGIVVFGGIPPGVFQVFVAAGFKSCDAAIGPGVSETWPGDGSAQASGIAIADSITSDGFAVNCF